LRKLHERTARVGYLLGVSRFFWERPLARTALYTGLRTAAAVAWHTDNTADSKDRTWTRS